VFPRNTKGFEEGHIENKIKKGGQGERKRELN
jgi:hypothetical protein